MSECSAWGVDTLADVAPAAIAELDLGWTGSRPGSTFKAWLDEPLTGGGAASAQEVVERHDGEIWCAAGAGRIGVRAAAAAADRSGVDTGARGPAPASASRPELYDFDLFDLP